MAAWPGTLPSAPDAAGYRYEPVPQSISSPMDTGPPKRRRRFSTAFGMHQMPFTLTDTQRATFETFYNTTMAGGSSTITGFTDPFTGSTSAVFQIAQGGDPKWDIVRPHGTQASRLWRVTMIWERIS